MKTFNTFFSFILFAVFLGFILSRFFDLYKFYKKRRRTTQKTLSSIQIKTKNKADSSWPLYSEETAYEFSQTPFPETNPIPLKMLWDKLSHIYLLEERNKPEEYNQLTQIRKQVYEACKSRTFLEQCTFNLGHYWNPDIAGWHPSGIGKHKWEVFLELANLSLPVTHYPYKTRHGQVDTSHRVDPPHLDETSKLFENNYFRILERYRNFRNRQGSKSLYSVVLGWIIFEVEKDDSIGVQEVASLSEERVECIFTVENYDAILKRIYPYPYGGDSDAMERVSIHIREIWKNEKLLRTYNVTKPKIDNVEHNREANESREHSTKTQETASNEKTNQTFNKIHVEPKYPSDL